MSLNRFPLPSIALVLASDHTPLPSRPSVIKFEFDPLQTIYLTSSGPTCVSNQTDTQIDPPDVQIDQDDDQPVVDEPFFFHVVNDSSTNVDSDNEQLDGESDHQTIFAEKSSTISRGSVAKRLKSDIVLKSNIVALANTIRNLLLQFKPKGSSKSKSAEVTRVVVNE